MSSKELKSTILPHLNAEPFLLSDAPCRPHRGPPALPPLLGVAHGVPAVRTAVRLPAAPGAGPDVAGGGGGGAPAARRYGLPQHQAGQKGMSVCLASVLLSSFFKNGIYFLFFQHCYKIFTLTVLVCPCVCVPVCVCPCVCVQMRECVLSFSHQLLSKFLDTASGEQVTVENLSTFVFYKCSYFTFRPRGITKAHDGERPSLDFRL